MKTILLAVGGRGGHIFPAVALAEHLRNRVPECRVCLAGKRHGQEQSAAEKYGIEFHPVRVARVPARKFSPAAVKFGGEMAASIASGISVVGKASPAAVVGFGGYVSFPTVLGAAVRGVPVYIHEQNALAGRANLILARFARGVFASYESTVAAFGEKAVLTGNPSRYEGLERISAAAARKQLGLDAERKTLFVFGGSQGAAKINEAMYRFAEMNAGRADLQVLHLAGRANYEEARERYRKALEGAGEIKIVIKDYLDEMHLAYFAADLAVCRAGATSIAEVTSLGVPSILVPYPYAAGNHQMFNAMELEKKGSARIVKDGELTGERLNKEIDSLLGRKEVLREMGVKAAAVYKTGAAGKMAEVLKRHL